MTTDNVRRADLALADLTADGGLLTPSSRTSSSAT